MSENESYRYTPCKGQTAFILMQECTVINIPIHGGIQPQTEVLITNTRIMLVSSDINSIFGDHCFCDIA